MKKLILFGLAAFALVSCKKENSTTPTSANTTETYTDLNIKTNTQVVKMSVTAGTLNMVYNEDVTLVVDSAKLNDMWAVHLKEDFDGTQLANFDYHSLTKYGVNATNWVDDNLNNIVIESSKDTLINNRAFVKKRVTRTFIYQKNYGSTDEAQTVLNKLLKQSDSINFSSYITPDEPVAISAKNSAKLSYVKM